MSAPAIGLQSHIWDNNFKSVVLLALYPIIILVMFAAITLACSGWITMYGPYNPQMVGPEPAFHFIATYWPVAMGIVGVWFVICYFFHTNMMRSLSHSHPVSRKEEPEIYNLLENLCISQGMRMPRLEIIESHARNAFASGIDEKSYAITLTRGLIQSLSKDELEAVIAHELTHIINRDVRLLMIAVIFTGMIGFAAQMAWSSMRYSTWLPRSGDKRGGGVMLFFFTAVAILWIGYFATLFTRFALSRKREYMADAGAIQLTKNPEAMMRALMRIAGMDKVPAMPADVAMMCVENSVPFLGLFATHPPIKERIEAISKTTNTPIPDQPLKMRAEREQIIRAPIDQRDNWITRQRFVSRRSGNPWS